ncbi:MAG: hypothetical protein MMC23_005475 [Stictis urceolatum]|nr:hypothetical protein [Stictis urceolata]
MNPNDPYGQPPSFKTNVNRMKTKRWVEAKSYSYDGDDWGDADDYDEYGGYDDPEPAPAPQKPTGLRQAGQAAGRPGPSSGSGPASDTNRAVSQPPQPPYQQGPRERAGSFTRGDERRAFSGPGGPQASTSPPPPIVNPMRTAYGQALNPDTGGRHPPPMGPGAGAGPGRPGQPPSLYQQPGQARSRPSIDSQGRTPSYDHRSPPPMGRPRQASDGYRSQSMTSNSSDFAGRRDYPSQPMPQPLHPASRPPRKSSLSQEQPSHPFAPSINTSVPPPNEPDAAQTSPASGQTPTLIRPADIYRRMHEEREKERQSQDSSRPSLEGILGNRPSSRDESPSQSGGDGSVARRRSPALGNVAERKSEYGMDGLLSPVSRDGPTPPSRGTSTSPVLPEISGFGEGFGSDFGSSFLGSDKRQSTVPSQPPRMAGNQDKTVQREPSMGFTSAVHQAFDQPAVSETPSSESGSGIGRSNSESTSVISPIISRGPSSATPEQKMKEAEAREQQIPAIEEEPNSASPRNRSIDHTNIPSKSSTHPPGFIPGHRRNVSTPSPDNSPARTPALELTKTLRYPQEIEIAQTTPTTATASNSTASNASRSGAPWDTQAAGLPRQTYNAARESPGPSSRADSPNKGRVRDLAEKINSGSNSRRGSQDSLKVQQEPVRPSNERLESFRPSLPGGWNSYTTNIAPGASREQTPQPVEESRTSIASTPRDISSGPTDAFAAAAAAGSALAGAFASAVGMGGNDSDEHEKSVSGSRSRGNTSLNPESYPQRTLLPHGDSSSSIMPTPLGMADGHDLSQDRDYFANVQPLQSKSRENIVNPPRVSTPPQRIPTMSTDPSPSDLESDKLRKQLVRELSPQAEEFSDEPGRLRPRVTDDSMLSADSAGERQARHDSSLLPSEYDSYWNGSHDGDTSLRVSKQPTQDSYTGNESPAVPQVLPQQDSLMVQSPIADSSLRHKFSWEAESEISAHPTPPMPQKGSVPMPIEMPVEQATSIPPQAASPTVSPPQPHNWNLEPAAGHERELSVASPAPIADTSKDLPQQPRAGSDPNTAVPRMVSSEQLAPSPPAKAKEPAKAGQLRVPSGPDVEFRALAFKEILALKTTEERINMFNTTRSKYAEHRVGLDHWIASTLNSIPDHMDLISRGGAIGTAIKPLVKAPTGGVSTQQPYYQQYLTANSTQGAIGSGSAISSTPSPSGPNKISTQQVQAKGKDILKGAGVLGGKANVAAKGLFAKGKKRFGGGDKVDH